MRILLDTHLFLWAVSATAISTYELPKRDTIDAAAWADVIMMAMPDELQDMINRGAGLSTPQAGGRPPMRPAGR